MEENSKKILVIQQKMIGDVLTSSILCELIKNEFPHHEVHYLINSHTYPVVEGNPFIDKIVFFKDTYRKNKLKFYSFLKTIKREQYDVVIDVYCKLESKLITYYSKAPLRISYNKSSSSYFYNILIDYLSEDKKTVGLAIQNRISLLTPIFQERPDPIAPKIYLSDKEKKEATDFLKFIDASRKKKLYMISILGSDLSKTYHFDYMAKLLNHIIDYKNATILFNYIPSQKEDVEKIYNLCTTKTQESILLDVYAPSLRSFLGVLAHCDAIIGNEGGAINMAKALDIPTFAIFSPWIKKEAWGLFEDKNNVTVHLNDFKPDLFENKSRKQIRENVAQLYQEFNPELFYDKLIDFLDRY
ncbi:MAG: glycosyltransferase family 9 protein [Flavobacteriaceae bacterium]|nr:glycosyltransferase family 9 protein [Flavobacteriaceae bacterium]